MGILSFDFDVAGMEAIRAELGATPEMVRDAMSRALRRTAGTLRKMASKGLHEELQLRSVSRLRRRLKTIRFSRKGSGRELRLWFGLNPIKVSDFRGRARKTAKGVSHHGHEYQGAFLGTSLTGYQTAFQRKDKARLPIREVDVPIDDTARIFLEDEIFEKAPEIFLRHFRQDLAYRATRT